MVNFQIGQIVFSKLGRDKGDAFIVVCVEGEYLYLSDGRRRQKDKPKKKKQKHVQPTNTVSEPVVVAINCDRLLDSDLRKALAEFESRNG